MHKQLATPLLVMHPLGNWRPHEIPRCSGLPPKANDQHRAWGPAQRFFGDAAGEKSREAGAAMRSHDDQIDLVFRGETIDLLRGIPFDDDVVDGNRRSRGGTDAFDLVGEPLSVFVRFELRSRLSKRNIFRPQRFDSVQYNQRGRMLFCQIDGHVKCQRRTFGEISRMQDSSWRKHKEKPPEHAIDMVQGSANRLLATQL